MVVTIKNTFEIARVVARCDRSPKLVAHVQVGGQLGIVTDISAIHLLGKPGKLFLCVDDVVFLAINFLLLSGLYRRAVPNSKGLSHSEQDTIESRYKEAFERAMLPIDIVANEVAQLKKSLATLQDINRTAVSYNNVTRARFGVEDDVPVNERYVLARKSAKLYMRNLFTAEVRSITSVAQKKALGAVSDIVDSFRDDAYSPSRAAIERLRSKEHFFGYESES